MSSPPPARIPGCTYRIMPIRTPDNCTSATRRDAISCPVLNPGSTQRGDSNDQQESSVDAIDDRLEKILQQYGEISYLVCRGCDLPTALNDVGVPDWKFKKHVRLIAESILVDRTSFLRLIQAHRLNLENFSYVARKILNRPGSSQALLRPKPIIERRSFETRMKYIVSQFLLINYCILS